MYQPISVFYVFLCISQNCSWLKMDIANFKCVAFKGFQNKYPKDEHFKDN